MRTERGKERTRVMGDKEAEIWTLQCYVFTLTIF